MKNYGREKLKIILVAICMLLFVAVSVKITYAEDDENKEQETTMSEGIIKALNSDELEYTEDYKKWLSLPEEEREKYIMPSSFGTPYETKKQSTPNRMRIFDVKANRSSRFDLRDHISIKVKDQQQTQSCWTFPMISEVETNISLTRGYNSPIFSARHMEYTTAKTFLDGINTNGYNREVGSGGNSAMALSYYTSGLGPVLEKDMPFQNSEAKVNLSEINKPVGQKIEKYVNFPSIYKEIENGVTIYKDSEGNVLSDDNVNEIRQQIKEHITNYGAVSANTNSSSTQYFNNISPILATAYYCNNNDVLQDHLVTIVGWDDNYAKENFNASCRPTKNGAWLIQNSYGAGFNGGYYYISYEDVMVERQNTGIVTIKDRDYKNLYQYDILATSIVTPVTRSDNDETVNTLYEANVFTRKESQKEILKEVAITGKGGTHTVDVYVNTKGELNWQEAELVASGVALEEGYQTIELTKSVELTNQKFAIIVKYTHPTEVKLAVEASLTANGIAGGAKWDSATANEGEGFISLTGNTGESYWQDVTSLIPTASLCIKAFTTIDDTQGPTITFEPNGNTTWGREQATKITVTDGDGVGVNESSLKYVWTQETTRPIESEFENWFQNGGSVKNNTESGNDWYVWAMAKDMQGNVTYAKSDAFYLDNIPPTAPTITTNVADNEWTKQSANISIAGSTNLSGIAKYQYTLNNGTTWSDVDGDFGITRSGIYRIKARAVGNTGVNGDISEEKIIKIDKDGPTITGITEGQKYKSVKPTITDLSEISAILTKDGVERIYEINSKNEGEEINENGNYTLTITDEVGNKTTIHFSIDAEPPVVTFNPNGNRTYQREQSTVVTVTDTSDIDTNSLKYIWTKEEETTLTEQLFNQNGTSFQNGETITKQDENGEYLLLIMAKDVVGNVALVRSEKFYIDSTGPTAPTIHGNVGNGNATNQNIKITINGSESASGIKKYQYSLDNGTSWIDINEGEEITFTEQGEYQIIARAINNLDMIGEQSEKYVARISKTAPTITFSPKGSNLWKKEQSTQITVTHTDTLEESSFKYVWSQSEEPLTEAQITEAFHSGEAVSKNTESGIWYVWAIAKDTLGNTTITKSEGFYLDNGTPTAPTITANADDNETIGETAVISLSGSESLSGIRKYQYSLDDKVTWKDASENEDIELEKDGTYVIYARAVNNVGKTGEIAGPYTIQSDTTPPNIKGIEEGGTYKEVTPEIEDDTEVEITLIKDGEEIPYKKGDEIKEDGEYTIKVEDEMGNETEIHFTIDTSGPTVTFTPNGNKDWATSQSTKVTVTDNYGIDESSLRYKWTQSVQVLTEDTFMPDSAPFNNGDTLTKDGVSGDNWCLWIYVRDGQGDIGLVKSNKFYIDNTVPTAPTITSNTGNGQTSTGDTTFQFSESTSLSGIAKYQYSINGQEWEDIAVGETLTKRTSGTYHVKARAVNNAGTIGVESSEYTVTVEKDSLVINFVPNGNETYQKEQNTKVNVTGSGEISSLKYLWSKQTEGITSQDFKDSFVNGQTINKKTQSEEWYLWILAQDENGQKIVRSNGFRLDNEIPNAPDVAINASENSTTSDNLEINISGSSSPSGIAKYQYSLNDGNTWIDVPVGQKAIVSISGMYKIKARAINKVGTNGKTTETYKVTVKRPDIFTINFEPQQNETYQREQATKVVIKSKNALSTLKYLWSNLEEGIEESDFKDTFTNQQTLKKNKESGSFYLWILMEDKVGNKVIERSGKFNLDNGVPTKPTLTKKVEQDGEKITIKIDGSTALSGIAKYQYSLDGGTTWRDIATGENIVLNEMGDYKVCARAVSNVGIKGETSQIEEITIKTKIPTIRFKPNGDKNYRKTQSTKIEAGSKFNLKPESLKYLWSTQAEGIQKEDFEAKQRSVSRVESYQSGQTVKKETDSGVWYLWAMAENEVGDLKIQRSEPFYFDNDMPIIEGVEKGKVYQDETVTPIIKDDTSNITVEVMLNGKEYRYKSEDSLMKKGIYQINVTDEAGNKTSTTFTIQHTEKDVTGPMISFSPNGNKEYKKEQSTEVEVEDPSGVKEDSLKYIWTDSKEPPKEEDFKETFKNGETIINKEKTGKVYLWIYAEDKEGNKSIIRSGQFYMDNTPPKKPSITANIENGGKVQGEVIITIEGGDGESDTHYEYSTDGGKTWTKVEGDTIRFDQEGTSKVMIAAVGETGIRSVAEDFTFTITKKSNPISTKISSNTRDSSGIIDNGKGSGMIDDDKGSDTAGMSLPKAGITSIMLIGIIVVTGLAIDSFRKLKKSKKEIE